MKKFNLFLVALISIFAFTFEVNAKDVATQDELYEALKAGENITITDDFKVTRSDLKVSNEVSLDLNEHTITFAKNKNILLMGASLEVAGKGTLVEEDPYYSPIMIRGSENKDDVNYTTLTIGKDVTIKGWAGIFINQVAEDKPYGYGITVNIYGTVVGTPDSTGDLGYGIYENGKIKDSTNAPVINIYKTAKISSQATGIYAAGYGTWTIEDGALIEGAETGIEIRAGILNVNGGTIIGNESKTEVTPDGNGQTTIGAGIAIAQHTTKLDITVNIKNGTIKGYTPLYESNPQNNSASDLDKVILSITGGKFEIINEGKDAIYSENKKEFITGGTFSSDVFSYTASKYITSLTKSGYVVEKYISSSTTDESNITATIETEEPFEKSLYLEVNKYEGEKEEEAKKEVADKYKNDKLKNVSLIGLYEINMVDGVAVYPMENGKFIISISIDEDLRKYDHYKVLYFDEDGKIAEEFDAKLDNEMLTFTTTHLSDYGIIGYNDGVKNPETRDNILTFVGMLVLSTITISSALKLKKRYN